MKLYAIIETANNRLIAFSNAPYNINDCYQIANIDHDDSLIGKRYNNGVWEEVTEPISEQDKFKSEYAKALGKV
jgi:hypothetical protein